MIVLSEFFKFKIKNMNEEQKIVYLFLFKQATEWRIKRS